MRRVVRGMRGLTAAAVAAGFAFVFGLAAVVTIPSLGGFKAMTVLTGSMRPSIDVGDVVVAQVVRPSQVGTGDVVTFADPSGAARLITHRVQSVRSADGFADVVTKGDANHNPERWRVADDGQIARVTWRIPQAGYLLQAVNTRNGRLSMVAVTVLLGLYSLTLIWRVEGSAATGEADTWRYGWSARPGGEGRNR